MVCPPWGMAMSAVQPHHIQQIIATLQAHDIPGANSGSPCYL